MFLSLSFSLYIAFSLSLSMVLLSLSLSLYGSFSLSLPLSVALTHSTTPFLHPLTPSLHAPPFSHPRLCSRPLPQVCDAGLTDQLHALQCEHRPLRKLRVAPWAEDQGRLRRLSEA